MSDLISMEKEYRTRYGKPVRVLCTDRDHKQYPVVVLIGEEIRTRTKYGFLFSGGRESAGDLIEVKPKIKGWANVYGGPASYSFGVFLPSKELCDNQPWSKRRIACVEIEFEEGEGL